ncbi:hypothetical protein FKM82_025395 [Ascaphus truei]
MNWIIILRLSSLIAAWLVCVSDQSQGTSPSRNNGDILTAHNNSKPGSLPARARFSQRLYPHLVRNQTHSVSGRSIYLSKKTVPPSTLRVEGHTQENKQKAKVYQGQNPVGKNPQFRMLKDDSATAARSRMVRFPSGSNSPNILASFAGKNRVWIISAPHASDGYYRLMMSLLKNDVYCELAERHIQQIILFHDEGEEGGKIRRINNEGKILEQPLDPSIIPKIMSSLKLEKGKFGMVLLKKTLQVEERYPYPVRLEAMYEVVDQSPIRKIEKIRQKGFVQKCKAAGIEGQVVEEGESSSRVVKPTQTSVQVSARKEEPKKNAVQPTRFSKVKTTRKSILVPPTPSPTSRATTAFPPTRATTRILTTTTRPPTTTPTTILPTTQKTWTTKAYTTLDTHRLPMIAEVTTREPETQSPYYPVRTDKRRDRQHVQTGKHFAPTSRTNKATSHESHTDAPIVLTTATEHYTKESTGRFGDNRTDRKDHNSHDNVPSQKKPPKTKASKKKAVEKILNNEYEDKFEPGRPTTSHLEEGIEETNVPQKKGKDKKKEEKADKIEKKKKKSEKTAKPPKAEKQAKKEKAEKKAKPEKDRNKKNKKGGKNDNDGFIKPAKKTFVESPKRLLSTFLENFEGKRRLLVSLHFFFS